MRVLVLGLSRTGTNCESHAVILKRCTENCKALRIALEQLGYTSTDHGFAATLENTRDCEMWLAALRAKFEGTGQSFRRSEFDQVLGHCQVLLTAEYHSLLVTDLRRC